MKVLSVRFADKQVLQIDDVCDKTGMDKSQVSRAAMQLGLEILRDEGRKGFTTAELIAINNMKALN